MKVSVMEIGDFHCVADITRVFLTEKKALKSVPSGFDRVETRLSSHYYENKPNNGGCKPQRWLTIEKYRVE